MPMLDALIAFALTMLALASVVTLVIEIIHRVLQLRSKGLLQMLEGLYDRELKPWVDKHLEELGGATGDARKRFFEQLLQNPLVKAGKLNQPLRSVEKMSDEEFLRRLGKTEVGKMVLRIARDKQEDAGRLVDRWAQTYEEYGQAASNFFARRAQVMSIIAGVILAFVGNINGVRILDTYLRDQAATQAVIAQSERFQEEWKAAEDRPAQDAGEAVSQADLDEVAAKLQSLADLGVPIGYDRYPVEWNPASWRFWSWWVAIVLTGFLLGLGGPFWFNIVTRLSQAEQAMSGRAATSAAPAGTAPAPNTPKRRLAMLGQPDAT